MSISALVDDIVRDVYATRYASTASAIIVYDHLLTLDNELELIWRSSWSIGKILFIINRYYTLISVVVNNYALFGTLSLRFFHWQGWTGLIACMISETILQMRLYALYNLNKKILGLMVGSFLLASASSATIMGIVLRQFNAVSVPQLGCMPAQLPPSYFYTFWIPILAFESLLCVLALVRGFQTYRARGSLFQSERLVGVLIRDSVCYYVVMFQAYLVCLLIWLLNIDLLEVPIGFTIAFSCVLGNRVILNVKKAKDDVDETYANSNEYGGSHPQQESDTLTDFEMLQLRAMRAKSPDEPHILSLDIT
ncbi:hypothetical protein BT96DRAFT_1002400 [Gymnopus androsaceus JB14]|uniref:DUF6533 domain-containing protein n=1 Tax=Gymnopus androsaceus JB14 TaxID=1447944 RepID=A0A6A4GWV1_9AGAR|nr:hypothetical protein BT96DRAFT_1002400 [Gymnopus androsaceus JB14]